MLKWHVYVHAVQDGLTLEEAAARFFVVAADHIAAAARVRAVSIYKDSQQWELIAYHTNDDVVVVRL
jgi:NhaP-type Na+/H+ and K+/H+ antiporter